MVSQAVLQKGQRMSGNLARWFNGSHCIKMIIIFVRMVIDLCVGSL